MSVRSAVVLVTSAILLVPTGLGVAQAGPAPHQLAADPAAGARATTDTVTVVAAGDIACKPGERTTRNRCRQGRTAALTTRLDPDAVIALGDLQYEVGGLRGFRRSYDRSWGAHKDITIPVLGNHEYRTTDAAGYFGYFTDQAAPGYTVQTLGAWRVYALNSNCTEIDCVEEARWLRADLAANPSTCSLFATHHPRYSSGVHEEDIDVSAFFGIAVQHHVELFLSGHDHDYERFARMDNQGRTSKSGVMQIVSGSGGKSHYAFGATQTGSAFRLARRFGVLKLTLTPETFTYAFKGIGGATRDKGTRHCRA